MTKRHTGLAGGGKGEGGGGLQAGLHTGARGRKGISAEQAQQVTAAGECEAAVWLSSSYIHVQTRSSSPFLGGMAWWRGSAAHRQLEAGHMIRHMGSHGAPTAPCDSCVGPHHMTAHTHLPHEQHHWQPCVASGGAGIPGRQGNSMLAMASILYYCL